MTGTTPLTAPPSPDNPPPVVPVGAAASGAQLLPLVAELQHRVGQLERANADLEKRRTEAEAAALAKDAFLAGLSHELRTPITPISLAIEVLSSTHQLSAGALGVLALMRRNIHALTRLVDDLLDITRIARGKVVIARTRLDLHAAIRAAAEVCEPSFHARGQQLAMALEADDPIVWGDFDRLRQCVWNLLNNASKFSPASETIFLSTRNGPHGKLTITITDRGIGIEPAMLTRVFDDYVQGGEWVTRQYGGLGLGLAIARRLVEAHHGRIWATSDGKDTGASFHIELPLGPQETAAGSNNF